MLEKRDVLLMSCFLHISSPIPAPTRSTRFSAPLLPHFLATLSTVECREKMFIPHLRHCQQTNKPLGTFAFFNWYVFTFTPWKFTVQLILCWIMTPIDNWLNDVCTSQEKSQRGYMRHGAILLNSLFIHHAPLLVLLALPLLLLLASVPLYWTLMKRYEQEHSFISITRAALCFLLKPFIIAFELSFTLVNNHLQKCEHPATTDKIRRTHTQTHREK